MDSLGKRDPEFGSLASEDMELMVTEEQPVFSAESGFDFRPRSSTWHGSNRTQFSSAATASTAQLIIECPPSPCPSAASENLELSEAPIESSAILSPAVGSNPSGGSSASAAAGGSGRSSLSPAGYPQASPRSAQQQKRRNAWGSQSYADLITQAIESSPQSRLTLSEIYDWMIKSISHFSSKGDTNSSAGWKNSVRHNLSLHSKFVRVQNEQTGKSSYWTIDYSVKDRASYRRRATTADVSKFPELQRKRQAALARRRQTSGSSATKLEARIPAPAPTGEPMQSPRTELQVASVLNQLVSPERLLDPSQTIETLLMESLSDAVLESFADVSSGFVAAAAVVAESSEPLRSLTDQLHLMTCRHRASGDDDPTCCWASASATSDSAAAASELCLPLIQESSGESGVGMEDFRS